MNDFCLRINTGTSNYRSKGGILGKKILFYKVDQCWRKNNKVGKKIIGKITCLVFQGSMAEKNLGLGKREALVTGSS